MSSYRCQYHTNRIDCINANIVGMIDETIKWKETLLFESSVFKSSAGEVIFADGAGDGAGAFQSMPFPSEQQEPFNIFRVLTALDGKVLAVTVDQSTFSKTCPEPALFEYQESQVIVNP